MNFEQLQQANATIKTTDVKGKAYAEVNQRIKAFRMLYPEGFIETELLQMENGVATMMARAGYYQDGQKIVLGTGTAQEKESSSYINKTSYVENCETSAVGRALGMMGIGIDASIASAEEVENAIANQEIIKKREAGFYATFDQIAVIKANIPADKVEKQLKKWNVTRFEDIPKTVADDVIAKIDNARKPIIQED